jgi:hypothetical protein
MNKKTAIALCTIMVYPKLAFINYIYGKGVPHKRQLLKDTTRVITMWTSK